MSRHRVLSDEERKEHVRESARKYRLSEKGRTTKARGQAQYEATEAGRLTRKRYFASEKGRRYLAKKTAKSAKQWAENVASFIEQREAGESYS